MKATVYIKTEEGVEILLVSAIVEGYVERVDRANVGIERGMLTGPRQKSESRFHFTGTAPSHVQIRNRNDVTVWCESPDTSFSVILEKVRSDVDNITKEVVK